MMMWAYLEQFTGDTIEPYIAAVIFLGDYAMSWHDNYREAERKLREEAPPNMQDALHIEQLTTTDVAMGYAELPWGYLFHDLD